MARSVTQILRELLDPPEPTLVAAAFLDLLDATKAALRRVACFRGRHAGGEVALDPQRKVLPHLLGHFRVEAPLAQHAV